MLNFALQLIKIMVVKFMFKNILINWVLPTVLDGLVNVAKRMTKQTDNTIDDAFVKTLEENKNKLLQYFTEYLKK